MDTGLIEAILQNEFRSSVLSRDGNIRLNTDRAELSALWNLKPKGKRIANVGQCQQANGSQQNDADPAFPHKTTLSIHCRPNRRPRTAYYNPWQSLQSSNTKSVPVAWTTLWPNCDPRPMRNSTVRSCRNPCACSAAPFPDRIRRRHCYQWNF
jgi:hypothetical protein